MSCICDNHRRWVNLEVGCDARLKVEGRQGLGEAVTRVSVGGAASRGEGGHDVEQQLADLLLLLRDHFLRQRGHREEVGEVVTVSHPGPGQVVGVTAAALPHGSLVSGSSNLT